MGHVPRDRAPRSSAPALKWITTLVPTIALYSYETVRHGLLETVLPTLYADVAAAFFGLTPVDLVCSGIPFAGFVAWHVFTSRYAKKAGTDREAST